MSSIKENTMRIEQLARELGFDGFGVTGAGSAKATERYKEWLNLGYEGEMNYMSRNFERRSDRLLRKNCGRRGRRQHSR